ncbi:MAG: GxxExxY protein [Candidatus Nitrosomaritimum yanchengensis]
MTQRNENELSYDIIGSAIEVHQTLGGPGLLESIYESSLYHELKLRGFEVQKQVIVPVKYKNTVVRDPLCLDILVDKKVIIEVKATERDHAIHQSQLLTYLRLTGIKLGLLINFGQNCVKDGVHRVVNGL